METPLRFLWNTLPTHERKKLLSNNLKYTPCPIQGWESQNFWCKSKYWRDSAALTLSSSNLPSTPWYPPEKNGFFVLMRNNWFFIFITKYDYSFSIIARGIQRLHSFFNTAFHTTIALKEKMYPLEETLFCFLLLPFLVIMNDMFAIFQIWEIWNYFTVILLLSFYFNT